ncbi:MAG: esterase-like activity of phytase family protein, partial [Bacteroidaceae bacterium]|nr:esterase-like activity of phytase family protein [Bacteroidaceae bacterium]
MKNFLFAILALAVAALPATAKVKVRKQQNLSRWHIAPANYSGLTPLGNDRYAVVDDKSATSGFHIFTIRLNPRTGKVE